MRDAKQSLGAVARAAGVSVATVSRVVRGNVSVDPTLAKRVREAAAKLGMAPEQTRRTKALVFILSNREMLHPFHSQILVGAEAQCRARAWDMIFLAFRYDLHSPCKKLHLPSVIQRGNVVNAVILAGTNAQNLLDLLAHKRIPFVVLGNNLVGQWRRSEYDAVFSNDIDGACEMTRHLQALGHRDIWFVGNCRLPWFARGFEGYRRAMEKAGLPARLSEFESEDTKEVGYLAAKSIFDRGEAVTAIFAGTDDAAQGAYKAVRDCGLRIPDDVSVVGCNDSYGAVFDPPLTTIREFPEHLGRCMVDLVLNRIAKPDLPPQQVTIPSELVVRGSCRSLLPIAKTATEERAEGGRFAQARSAL